MSNDNPYSESLFNTLNYPQLLLKPFESLLLAKRWITKLVHWYNGVHRQLDKYRLFAFFLELFSLL